MLRWIEQKFNKDSAPNSPTNTQLDQEEGQSSSIPSSSFDLTDGDYEFLFNQLLEGVAHGWHQVRIAKFFQQLEERGEAQKWVAWLKRCYQKFPASPSPIQRQMGARMIRLGEITQSHAKFQEIGAVSLEIGRKLFFGNTAEILWEYDGADVVSIPSPESNVVSAPTPNLPTQETDQEYSVIQDGIISDNSGELSLDTEEFPLFPEDESEYSVIQDEMLSDHSKEESILIPENIVGEDNTHLTIEDPDEPESPWEQPELIAAIPELPIDEAKQQSEVEDSPPESSVVEAIKESPQEEQSHSLTKSKQALPTIGGVSLTNLTREQLIDLLKQDQNLVREISEQLGISSTNPNVVIQAVIQQINNLEQSSKNLENSELLESWFDLGLKQASAGEFEKAIASWDKVLEFNPNLAEVWHNRGSALGRLGKYSESVIAFDRALEIEPNHYQAWNDRAHALYLLEKWQEAIHSWDKAISIMPNNHQFWYNRGCALEQLKLIEESIASYEKALEIQPDFELARSRYLNLLADK